MLSLVKEIINMKKLNVALAILVTAVMAGNAQTTVTSDIVGYQTTSVPVGLSALGFPLLNPNLVSGVVSANTTSTVSITGGSGIVGSLVSTKPYYIEVTSGSLVGERFDVNVATTTSDTVGIDTASLNNTRVLSAGALTGQSVALRQHITLNQIQSMFASALTGNNTASLADSVILVEAGAAKTYYLRADGVTWRTSGDSTDKAYKAIAPGTGILFKKVGSAGSLTAVGNVRGNDFARNYVSGLQLTALPFPLEKSPSAIGGAGANGWVGSNTQASADQICVFESGAAKTYYLRSGALVWRTSGDTADYASTAILKSDAGYYVKKASAGTFLEPKP